MAQKTLDQVQADAQAIFADIQQKGVSVANRPEIVAAAQKMLGLLNDLQQHVNDAHSAFGNQSENITKMQQLRNTLNKIIATYSS